MTRLEQVDGHGVLLSAWRAELPIGMTYLWLAEAEEPESANTFPAFHF